MQAGLCQASFREKKIRFGSHSRPFVAGSWVLLIQRIPLIRLGKDCSIWTLMWSLPTLRH